MSFFQKKSEEQPSFEPLTEKEEMKSQIKDFIWETLKVIVLSLAIIIPIRYFIIQPFYVKGASMEPNFHDHEYLIIDEISYRLREPRRGEVIVFRYPYDRSQYFIKRLIGLPGETIKIENGQITIVNQEHPDGFVLNEEMYLPATYTQGSELIALADDEYYIMGDNRDASLDSRSFGSIKESDIIGRTLVRCLPFDKIKIFNEQVY